MSNLKQKVFNGIHTPQRKASPIIRRRRKYYYSFPIVKSPSEAEAYLLALGFGRGALPKANQYPMTVNQLRQWRLQLPAAKC